METLGLVVDFGNKRMCWSSRSDDWFDVSQPDGTHYTLDMLSEMDARRSSELEFRYIPDDAREHIAADALALVDIDIERDDHHDDDVPGDDDAQSDDNCHRDISKGRIRSLLHSLDCASKALDILLSESKTIAARPRKVWEVYVGRGRITQILERLGAETRTFGLHNGWDLTDPHRQADFVRLMDDEEPDEIFMSPMCGPWSQMQELNCGTDTQRAALHDKR